MKAQAAEAVRDVLDRLYHAESRRILAILIRLLGDIDTAEDALQDAFAAAARQWPEQGIPANPRSWLISTGRLGEDYRALHAPTEDRTIAGRRAQPGRRSGDA